MNEGHTLKASRDTVASWIAGWALSRGVGPPTPAYDGFRVDVGLPDQKARYVFVEASSGVEEASRAIVEPNIFIKVCAPPDVVESRLADGWSIRPVSFMMTADELFRADMRLPSHYSLVRNFVPGGRTITISTDDGELAASGGVFLVGSTAVFDRIETHPNHRRRGLGRAVMGELGAIALGSGAAKGALVATPAGRELYSTMGWRLHSLYTTAIRE